MVRYFSIKRLLFHLDGLIVTNVPYFSGQHQCGTAEIYDLVFRNDCKRLYKWAWALIQNRVSPGTEFNLLCVLVYEMRR